MGRIDDAWRLRHGNDISDDQSRAQQFESAWPGATATAPVDHRIEAAKPAPAEEPVRPDTAHQPKAVLIAETPSPILDGLSAAWADRLASSPNANPTLVEQFRRIAASLHQAQANSALKVVMVTSAEPGEGKTLTATNLALTLSESYRRRVLLIDADLRRPSINKIAQIKTERGLNEGLKSTSDEKLTVYQLTSTLTLLPAGRPDPNPLSGLTSPRMRHILEEAAARFDWVILDAPPVAPITDANLLADVADTVIFVVRAGQTNYEVAQKAVETLGRDRIFGVVLNAAEEAEAEPYGHSAYLSGMAGSVA